MLMKKILPFILSATAFVMLCACEASDSNGGDGDPAYYYSFDEFGRETFLVEIDANEWSLTGNVTLDGEPLIAYDISDTDNIPYPLTNKNLSLTYGSLDDSSDQEIIYMSGSGLVVTRISASELEINLSATYYVTTRSFKIELNCSNKNQYIVVDQTLTSEEVSDTDGASRFYLSGEYTFDVEYIYFDPNLGGSYTIESVEEYFLPDTGAVEDSYTYYYPADMYYYNRYRKWGSAPWCPTTEDDSYPLETTTGLIDGSDTEEIIKIYDKLNDTTITKLSPTTFEITMGANTTGVSRRAYLNFSTSSEFADTFKFYQIVNS